MPLANSDGSKTAKACEPCRRRKVKCDGKEPACSRCRLNPSACAYRVKARIRLGHRSNTARVSSPLSAPANSESPSSVCARIPSGHDQEQQDSHPAVYECVSAAHQAPQASDSSQLFYGPSSNFALLQQIHQQILSSSSLPSDNNSRRRAQYDATDSLDFFIQKGVFFGVPLRVDPTSAAFSSGTAQLYQMVTKELACSFLENFKTHSLQLLPFFSDGTLNTLLHSFYDDGDESQMNPQKKALFLMALAIGALGTTHTELADRLYLSAKREVVVYEDVVTLPMIQFSLMVSDYQINMGRPNAAYLHVGAACRKALAWGLHYPAGNISPGETQDRCATLWCMYYMEMWLSLTVGRKSVICKENIDYPYPDNQPLLVKLCHLASILEDVAELVYWRKANTLWQLHETCQGLYARLQEFGEKNDIASMPATRRGTVTEAIARMTIHSAYYHLVYTTFRPFMIAGSAIKSKGGSAETEQVWFKEACSKATEAAINSIVYIDGTLRHLDATKVRRGDSFVIEAICSVLLHDSLLHPTQHSNNVVYIYMALKCLRSMSNDEPVTNVACSIQRILNAVEHSIPTENNLILHSSPSIEGGNSLPQPDIQVLPVNTTADSGLSDPTLPRDSFNQEFRLEASNWIYPFHPVDFDVLTTDLFNFFPSDIITYPPPS